MEQLEEQIARLDMDTCTPDQSPPIKQFINSPLVTEIFENGMDIYDDTPPEMRYVILEVPNVYCCKYFDDEDFIYAKLRFSDSITDSCDLNLETYLLIHQIEISPQDLSLHPNSIFAKVLFLYQHSSSYFSSLRHLRPLQRVEHLPPNFLEWVNNLTVIIRHLLDSDLFNYTPNELIPKEMFNEFSYGLHLITTHLKLICNHYISRNNIQNNTPNNTRGMQELQIVEEKHLKKLMRLVNNLCVIMIYFKLAF